jgi:glycosyltransferase involved in cell wall biosynthesis
MSGDATLPSRTRLGPPGVDVEAFQPRDDAAARLSALVARLAEEPAAAASSSDVFARDAHAAARALSEVDVDADRLVVFVGKLIASKGAELLLAAWPRVLAAEPAARLVIVGFGGFQAGLQKLAAALASGDLDAARALRAEDGRALPELAAYLDGADGSARLERVVWTGRRRWWRRARSRRRSAWSPPRAPPAARCRSSRGTPVWPRCRRRSPRACRPRRVAGCPSRWATAPSESSPTA